MLSSTLHDLANAFVYFDTDENGNRRVMVLQEPPVPLRRMRVLANAVDTPADRRAVWQVNSCCVNCQCWIESPDAARLIATDEGPRLACRSKCFAQAMLKHHRQIRVRAAVRHQQRCAR